MREPLSACRRLPRGGKRGDRESPQQGIVGITAYRPAGGVEHLHGSGIIVGPQSIVTSLACFKRAARRRESFWDVSSGRCASAQVVRGIRRMIWPF